MSDAKQYVLGTGRRKTSVARVRLAPGSGQVTVNGKPLSEYFTIDRRQRDVINPLTATDALSRYDVSVTVDGGGETGQAGACTMGIARALLKAEPQLEAAIRTGGFLTRDSRMVERKKYGKRGARRGCQFSKR